MNVIGLCLFLMTLNHIGGGVGPSTSTWMWVVAFAADNAILMAWVAVRGVMRAPRMEDHP